MPKLSVYSKAARAKFGSPEYRAWAMMKARCYTKSYEKYGTYGARGIKVCDRWKTSFENFLADMGRRPSPEHSIDRKDNDGDYTPENCRWATRFQQAQNRRCANIISVNGEAKNLQVWADERGIDPQTITDRIERGWTPEEAVNTPARKQRSSSPLPITYRGKTLRLFEWAQLTGISASCLSRRISRGWTLDRVFGDSA